MPRDASTTFHLPLAMTATVNNRVDNRGDTESKPSSPVARELLIAAIALVVGLVVMPAVIYVFGFALLGSYGGGPHGSADSSIGSFLGDFFRNLGSGATRTWFLVLSPLLLLTILRLLFRRWTKPKNPEDFREPPAIADVPVPPKGPRAKEPRREPFVSP